MQCGAKTRSGEPCKNDAMANGRCRMHGGATPSGLALPQTKTFRYTKYLPSGIVDRYHAALADETLLSLRDEIALVDIQTQAALEVAVDAEANPLKRVAAQVRIHDLVEQRRKLVESERKRLIDMQQMITTEQAMALIGALVGVIREHVHDRDTLAAIQRDLNGLLAQRTGERTEST